ncbi:MAG: MerR family DNA-binding transcriptional regulator [Chloroflexi bacterium]|nr:MerR family DNA-binding transcriptional regulator [Chloroflexota bacterium]
MIDSSSSAKWLRLSEASRRLKVSPSTLRRWADAGRVPYRRTPGGQRIFAAADITRLQAQGWPKESNGSVAPEALLQKVRNSLAAHPATSPTLLTATLQVQRQAGRQLLGLAVQYVARHQNDEAILVQARKSGYQTGHRLATTGCSAAQAAERFYFFVDRIENVILGDIAIGEMDSDQQRAQQRLKQFFREVLFGVMRGLDDGNSEV